MNKIWQKKKAVSRLTAIFSILNCQTPGFRIGTDTDRTGPFWRWKWRW